MTVSTDNATPVDPLYDPLTNLPRNDVPGATNPELDVDTDPETINKPLESPAEDLVDGPLDP